MSVIAIIILAILQGVLEWIPMSSEGFLVLVMLYLNLAKPSEVIQIATWLHIGTWIAAIIYYRRIGMTELRNFRKGDKWMLKHVSIGTLASFPSGIIAIKLLNTSNERLWTEYGTLIIGIGLLITATITYKSKTKGFKKAENVKITDSALLGLLEGIAIIPGISRSGMTILGASIRGYGGEDSLDLSFTLSIGAIPAIITYQVVTRTLPPLSTNPVDILASIIPSVIVSLPLMRGLIKIARSKGISLTTFILGMLTLILYFLLQIFKV